MPAQSASANAWSEREEAGRRSEVTVGSPAWVLFYILSTSHSNGSNFENSFDPAIFVWFCNSNISCVCRNSALSSISLLTGIPSHFQFQQMWIRHPTFMDLVANSWSAPTHTRPMLSMSIKRWRLKLLLKTWNKALAALLVTSLLLMCTGYGRNRADFFALYFS